MCPARPPHQHHLQLTTLNWTWTPTTQTKDHPRDSPARDSNKTDHPNNVNNCNHRLCSSNRPHKRLKYNFYLFTGQFTVHPDYHGCRTLQITVHSETAVRATTAMPPKKKNNSNSRKQQEADRNRKRLAVASENDEQKAVRQAADRESHRMAYHYKITTSRPKIGTRRKI